MKTKFVVQLHKKGEYCEDIFKMIQNHNGGLVNIDIDVIVGFLLAKKAMHPTDKLEIKTEGENGQTISISDDGGKTFHTTITEREIQEYPITEQCFITTGSDEEGGEYTFLLCSIDDSKDTVVVPHIAKNIDAACEKMLKYLSTTKIIFGHVDSQVLLNGDTEIDISDIECMKQYLLKFPLF